MGGTLIVSLDFELFWGMLDCSSLEAYRANVLGGRKAIPQLLSLFRRYDIHATWAAVGFLFGANYEELSRYFPEESLRPSYEKPEISPRLPSYPYLFHSSPKEISFSFCFTSPIAIFSWIFVLYSL